MKITFVMPGAAGGGARMVARFAAGLLERNHDVRILHPEARATWRNRLRNAYLGLRYRGREGWLRTFPGEIRPYRTLSAELIGRNDFLIGVGVDCVLAIADFPDPCGTKVHSCHGRENWRGETMERAWRLSMPRIVTTTHLVDEMRRRDTTDDIFVAHYGIDRTEYYPSLGPEQRSGVGTVYHGANVKDPRTMLNVLRLLAERRPGTPLYSFGTFPRPRGMPEPVHYVRLPTLDAARGLYSRSRVWFCTSLTEGFALPPLEAMACGCAVVTTDCGGPSDFIESGTNGFIVPVGDSEALTSNIVKLLDDEALRRKFVQISEPIVARFTWTAAIDAFESALVAIRRGTNGHAKTIADHAPRGAGAPRAMPGSVRS